MDSDKKSILRAKSTISFEALQDLMKEHIGEPTDEWMEIEDDCLIIKLYLHFFVALAQQTTRLNAVAVAQRADSLWKLGKNKAHLLALLWKMLSLTQRKLGTKQFMAPSSLVR